jgi:hypothetical protein
MARGRPPDGELPKRKKVTVWTTMVDAAQLPRLPPGVPPRTKALSASLRTPRVGLVRRMHPGVEGDGGRDLCEACRFGPHYMSWEACRGKGGGTRGHGPDRPDWPRARFPDGCRVQCVGFTGTVTGFCIDSGFFQVDCGGGNVREEFLSHASHKAQVGARRAAAARSVRSVGIATR